MVQFRAPAVDSTIPFGDRVPPIGKYRGPFVPRCARLRQCDRIKAAKPQLTPASGERISPGPTAAVFRLVQDEAAAVLLPARSRFAHLSRCQNVSTARHLQLAVPFGR